MKDKQETPVTAYSSEDKDFLDAIFASIQDGISILDPDLTIRFTNRVMEKWYAHAAPLRGKKCHEVYHSSPTPCAECPTIRCIRSRKVEAEIVPGPPHSGSPVRWLELYAYPIHHKGEVTGVVEFVRDITLRKEAENERDEVHQRFLAFSDASPDLFFAKDIAGRYLFVNAANARFFGLHPDDIIGKTDYDLMPTREAAERCTHSDRLALAQMDLVITRETVGERVYEVYKFPLLINNQLSGVGGIARDITEQVRAQEKQRELEKRLHQAHRLESIGRLAGGVAHDYNNMLGVILAYADLALHSENLSETVRGYLQEILKAAQRSRDITQQLLAFARRQPINPRVLDLNKTVEETLGMLRRLIGENVELIWKPFVHCPLILADPVQIQQILTNLCVNARDAIGRRGTICIETGIKYLDEVYCATHAGAVPGEYAALSVTDDGCGMDKDTLDKIFEPFFSTKEDGHGTGLGLATVYGIVKQNNGFIEVESELGRGSSFQIYFPAHQGQVETNVSEDVFSIPQAKGETILVV
ncbi:MAG TPA: PAS domain-containing protein, partial [Candidatus Hydrogenedentes bacterium]|nr:PAS domain-containing protein [Candidatus Hydrogenedentota bacterium]